MICGFLFSCDEDLTSTNEQDNNEYFGVKVLGKGPDCGDVFLVEFIEKLNEVEARTGEKSQTYYADELPNEFKKDNIELLFKFRNPTENELYPCTTFGPSYPHIIVLDVKQNKDLI